jgi:hypothetical protein
MRKCWLMCRRTTPQKHVEPSPLGFGPLVRLHTEKIAAAINTATPGSYAEVQIPCKL